MARRPTPIRPPIVKPLKLPAERVRITGPSGTPQREDEIVDIQTTELIAIGASVTANCVPCLRFHLTKAREGGVTENEIREAVRVGRMVRRGAASQWDKEAAALLGQEDADEAGGP